MIVVFKKTFVIFREREKERNNVVREKHRSAASRTLPTGDPARKPGTYPDWELNQ